MTTWHRTPIQRFTKTPERYLYQGEQDHNYGVCYNLKQVIHDSFSIIHWQLAGIFIINIKVIMSINQYSDTSIT